MKDELRTRIDEILHYVWDPIGVSPSPAARDEYRSYAGKIEELLRGGADLNKIQNHLLTLESSSMGIESCSTAKAAAKALIDWRDYLLGLD